MRIFETAGAMREYALAQRAAGRTIGFVPTMGALHEGHSSLMHAAVEHEQTAVLSIFVNPAQFAPHEDLEHYPRTWEADLALASEIGIHAVYAPSAASMYGPGYSTFVIVEGVSEGLCGGSRPHFFRGVATVVTKLFNAVLPHRAYFGQKDAQQCAVIKRMVRDLDMGIDIVEMPIVREPDGLAMSSRNRYLSPEDRARGLCLSKGLGDAATAFATGERSASALLALVRERMQPVEIDYVQLVDAESMEPVEIIEREALLAVAAQVGPARLIDNVKLTP